MTRFVIDPASLISVVRDRRTVDPAHQLVAPNSIRSQALELLLVAVGQGEMTEREALDTHERITELKMRLLGDRISRRAAWQLARAHNWDSLRHAEYLAITKLQADALITEDGELRSAARDLVVVAPLSALF